MDKQTHLETLKNKLAVERGRLRQAAESFGAEEFLRPGEGGWSARDILAHIAASEELNVRFARLMVLRDNPNQLAVMAADYPDFQGPFALDAFNAYMIERHRAMPPDAVFEWVRRVRATTLEWVNSLEEEQLGRRGRHAVWGEQTVYSMIRILGLHDKLHTQDLLRLREAASG